MLSQITNRFKSYRTRQRVINELSALDDRQLADIGINRGDINRAVAFGRY
ncbi:DUF1127 domain-containing protein [Aureimonas fodinaquatilis]|uniref:DUF1127 domain-containing protein n=1 Tax=Aureimonas fodinaquatilis TaxID=2565783 RepID=A0A5B0DNY4_9HYPH|nr:DUF1127 domain-containing protein [Aureimonas fodinaquatilis]KAA0968464.1 DUF1127 domain-containing protein [Aureimonas fodinaquatilis]